MVCAPHMYLLLLVLRCAVGEGGMCEVRKL